MSGVTHYCDVVTTADEEITCRMRLDYRRNAGEQELIVFASTFEEATCNMASCMYTFLDTDQLPTVENIFESFNSATGKHEIEVNGFGITDVSTSTVDAFIGGIAQTVLSVTPTQVIIQIDDVRSGLSPEPLELYFVEGAPNGLPDIYNNVPLTPVFLGVETS